MACKVYDLMNIQVAQIVMGKVLDIQLLFNTFWSHSDHSAVGIFTFILDYS